MEKKRNKQDKEKLDMKHRSAGGKEDFPGKQRLYILHFYESAETAGNIKALQEEKEVLGRRQPRPAIMSCID